MLEELLKQIILRQGDPQGEEGTEISKLTSALTKEDVELLTTMLEELSFYKDFYTTLLRLEERLHTTEDMDYISDYVIKTCCLFYDADWCGLLLADPNTRMFSPRRWYERSTDGMTPTLFQENEYFETYPRWVKALDNNEAVVIPDIEAIKPFYPEEYDSYVRLKAYSIIGTPFGKRPTGFMIVRNPKKHKNDPGMVRLLTFVSMSQYYIGMMLGNTPQEEAFANQVRVNIFGEPSIECRGNVISYEKYAAPKSWKLLAYLILKNRPAPAMTIASSIWPEEGEKGVDKIRQTIHRIRERLAGQIPENWIVNSNTGYFISPDIIVTTDAQEMEELVRKAEGESDAHLRARILEDAFELYKGEAFAAFADEQWLSLEVGHYAHCYNDLVKMLLEALDELNDYSCIEKYAGRALQIVPGNKDAWYWQIIAMSKTGLSEAAKRKLAKAQEALIEEEYEELLERLGGIINAG